MIIESYIIKDKQAIISNIENIDKSLFVNIKDYNLLDVNNLDYDYLEGAIVLIHNNQELLGFKNWDLIEQLWSYFVAAIEELKKKEKIEFQFPDCPFLISIEKKNNTFLNVLFHDRKIAIDSSEFVSDMLNSALLFYENLKRLFIDYEYEIGEQIENIRNIKNIWSVK
jgi:hypothetical protein